MTTHTTTTWLQYTHLEKLYGYLPGMPDALPSVFAMPSAEYHAIREGFTAAAWNAAHGLLADPEFAALVDALPFTPGQTVLAVGDSVTDDLQSWAEILRHLLELRRPELGVRLVNNGLSAHTTTMVLRRWPATVNGTRPDWVLCGLGGNDITRVGGYLQVDPAASVANLRRLRAIAPDPHWLWLTPVPVDEERVTAYPAFRFGGSSWRNDDIHALVEAMRDLDDPVVDLVAAIGVPVGDGLQGEDGVHPTLAGQTRIVRAVVERLANSGRT